MKLRHLILLAFSSKIDIIATEFSELAQKHFKAQFNEVNFKNILRKW